jgi:hypothetical protein
MDVAESAENARVSVPSPCCPCPAAPAAPIGGSAASVRIWFDDAAEALSPVLDSTRGAGNTDR